MKKSPTFEEGYKFGTDKVEYYIFNTGLEATLRRAEILMVEDKTILEKDKNGFYYGFLKAFEEFHTRHTKNEKSK